MRLTLFKFFSAGLSMIRAALLTGNAMSGRVSATRYMWLPNASRYVTLPLTSFGYHFLHDWQASTHLLLQPY